MNTQMNVCNLIWVDDEIDTLLTTQKKHILEREGFKIIGVARTYKDFINIIDICYDRVDAVITDANFNIESTTINGERDLSGFVKIRECRDTYNLKRDIPFYLYTKRIDVLHDKYEDGELDYFENNNRIFDKAEFSEMIKQIRKDVEHINSPSFRIRNKYSKELEAAKAIDGNEEALFNALMHDYSENWNNAQDFFNPARKIVERIFDACKKESIIPQLPSLNSFSYFLQGKDEKYEIREGCSIMPRTLVHSLKYFLDITQDGSHGTNDLLLGVDSYVRESKNINLFRTILYIAMDICLWYAETRKNSTDHNQSKWQLKPSYNFIFSGIIKNIDGKLIVGEYQIHNKDCNCSEGDEVGICLYKGKDISDNTKPFTYIDEGREIKVSKYAFPNNVVIIKKNN